ncbi:MAG: AzlD domain-containing protein [Firmicutes bacterium]|nr:AzlD domain-containing protein [Bacillota bacterium]
MEESFILILAGMALVTYLTRVLPLLTLTEMKLPPSLLCWLSFIPVAVLGALLGPELLLHGGNLDYSLGNYNLLAALPSFVVAVKTRSLLWTVVAGMGVVVLLRSL